MNNKIKVVPGQAYFEFKFLTATSSLQLTGGNEPKGMISEDLAYRIYKMLLDDAGRVRKPDLAAISTKSKAAAKKGGVKR